MSEPTLLFAPGAGASSSSPWMRAWERRLKAIGPVRTFDYPYQRSGRRFPDRLPTLIACHREQLAEARAQSGAPVVLVGKSMGGRIGCHVALEATADVQALVCFGYPLVGQNGALRDRVLLDLRSTRILFVQGTEDSLCPLGELERVRGAMRAPNALHVVPDADHSLLLSRKALAQQGLTQGEVDERILRAVSEFVVRPARG